MGAGLMRIARTTLFFPQGDNAADPIFALVPAPLQGRLVAQPDGPGRYRFDIILHGGAETPFFQD